MSEFIRSGSTISFANSVDVDSMSHFITTQLDLLDERTKPRQANLLHQDVARFVDAEDQQKIRKKIAMRLGAASSMTMRFSVALQPDIAPYIGAFDLSAVRFPADQVEYERQKYQYRALKEQMGLEQFDRESDESELTYSQPTLAIIDSAPYALVSRNRHVGQMKHYSRSIKIGKRTTMLFGDPQRLGKISIIDQSLLSFSGGPSVALQLDEKKVQERIDEGSSDSMHIIENSLYVYVKHHQVPRVSE